MDNLYFYLKNCLHKYSMNFNDYLADLNEALKVKYVVRKNKKVKKWKTDKPGWRVEYDENGKPREVRMKAAEKRKRKLGQRKGKIKRNAKMNLIKLKQKKSFIARKNMGIQYNKKVPDINLNRKPYEPVKTPFKKDKLLSPSFTENFKDYINEKNLLLEWPENVIWSDDTKGIDIGWDWCSETTPEDGEWLKQLVTLFKYGTLKTLRDDRNQPANEDGFVSQPYLYFDKAQLEDIADNLMLDWGFLQMANHDLQLIKDEKLMKELKEYVPDRLWTKIINYK